MATVSRSRYDGITSRYPASLVLPAVGLSAAFAQRVTGRRDDFSVGDVLALMDQDSYGETFVPRSRTIDWLEASSPVRPAFTEPNPARMGLRLGHVLDLVTAVPAGSVQCVVTSTPYWATRVYEDAYATTWADGEICPYGHEQVPEGFVRHTVEVLLALSRVVAPNGSIWWNIMDTFNTRTQVRSNALETLRAMQGLDGRAWGDHAVRRYSAGHA